MTPEIDQAIIRSLAYAHFFRSPLTLARLHRFLITPTPVGHTLLGRRLTQLCHRHLINLRSPLYCLPSFDPQLSKDYKNRLLQVPSYLQSAHRLARFLSLVPSVRLVCLTGSVAACNPKVGDDLDFMIVTSPHTLWLTRLIINPLFTLFFHLRKPRQHHTTPSTTCLNLWLDSDNLLIPRSRQSLYAAYELAQAIPLLDRHHTHKHLIAINTPWASKFLANAYNDQSQLSSEIPNLKSKILSPLNALAFKLQYLYMKPKMTSEYVTLHQAFFHPYTPLAKINAYLSNLKSKI